VVSEITGSSAAVEHLLRPHVKRVAVANPSLVRAIAYARPAFTAMKLRKVALEAGAPRAYGKVGPGRDDWIKEIRERGRIGRARRGAGL